MSKPMSNESSACVLCKHRTVDREGCCVTQVSPVGRRPIRYCACKCEFTSASPAESGVELLPCPFCGSGNLAISNELDEDGNWVVWCLDCKGGSTFCEHKTDAVAHWNTRVPPERIKALAELDARRADGYEQIWRLKGEGGAMTQMIADINYLRTFVRALAVANELAGVADHELDAIPGQLMNTEV